MLQNWVHKAQRKTWQSPCYMVTTGREREGTSSFYVIYLACHLHLKSIYSFWNNKDSSKYTHSDYAPGGLAGDGMRTVVNIWSDQEAYAKHTHFAGDESPNVRANHAYSHSTPSAGLPSALICLGKFACKTRGNFWCTCVYVCYLRNKARECKNRNSRQVL